MTAAADFSPEEWLAIVPAALQPPPPIPGPLKAPADPAAAARAERPLTGPAMLSAVRSLSAGLAAWLDAQFVLAPFNARVGLRYGAAAVFGLALCPAFVVLNDGRFPPRALGWGIAAYCLLILLSHGAVMRAAWRSTVFGNAKAGSAPADPDLGAHAFAPLARWKQLLDSEGLAPGAADSDVELGGRGTPCPARRSRLVAHRDGDPLCPCPLPSCAGNLARAAAWSRTAEIGVRYLFSVGGQAMAAYTLAATFAPRFWTSWFWALLGALYFAGVVWATMLGGLGRVSASFPAMGLVERLHVRATSIALGSLLDRLEAQLAGDVPAGAGEGEAGARKGEEELYVRLHLVLSTVWQKRIPGLWTGNAATLSMFAAVALICIFFNIIGGLCIPAYALSISAFVLSIFLLDLSGIAAGNSQIRSVSALYSSAQQSLRRLALLHPSHPLLPALDRHDRMLGSFTDARAYEMRFWGFAVGYGTVRTIAATVLTVGFGLWSVARGSGVYVTPETVCY